MDKQMVEFLAHGLNYAKTNKNVITKEDAINFLSGYIASAINLTEKEREVFFKAVDEK